MTPLISSGSCVIAIDHVPKSVERRSKGPIGTSAKRRATGGSMIQMETVEAFIPGRGGIATLTLIKDRHGHVRALTDRNDERIGMFRMETSENGFIDAAIDATAALLQTYAFRPEGKVAATMEELVEQARELFPDEVPTVRELRNALRISNGRANDVGRLLRGDTTAA